MIRINASHFVAGVVLARGRAARAAPILRYMVGWTTKQVIEYCERKGWRWELLP
jgi:hypothetical protein